MTKNKILKLIIIFIVFAIVYIDLVDLQKAKPLVEETGQIKSLFCEFENCIQQLIKITNNSKNLKCAFYDITNENLIKHLQKENAEIISHKQEKFEKINTTGLMHHKFCIINQTTIIAGSYNPTQKNDHHENLIMIESSTLAKNYEQEFEQLKQINDDLIDIKQKTKTNKIIFNDQTLENYFCPQDNCQEQILKKISQANKSISFILFTFTDKQIAQEIINKHNQGIKVQGIIENFQNKKQWTVPMLTTQNIPIKIHSSNNFQHNKIIIIDDMVITGSYNPTKAANTINDENILIITQTEIVQEYKNYFEDFFESSDLD